MQACTLGKSIGIYHGINNSSQLALWHPALCIFGSVFPTSVANSPIGYTKRQCFCNHYSVLRRCRAARFLHIAQTTMGKKLVSRILYVGLTLSVLSACGSPDDLHGRDVSAAVKSALQRSAVFEGYTLFTRSGNGADPETILMDNDFEPVNTWTHAHGPASMPYC